MFHLFKLHCNKLPISLCTIVDRRSKNSVEAMFMHKSGHVDDRLIDYLNVIGNENRTKFN